MRRWIVLGLLLTALWALWLWRPQKELPSNAEVQVEPPPAPTAPSSSPAPARARPPSAASATVQDEPAPAAPATSPTYKLPTLPPPEAHGPVRELKVRFGNESSSATSKQHEQQVKEVLDHTGPPLGSVQDIVCRRSVCRVSWRWKAQHVIPFGQSVGALQRNIDPNMANDAAGPPDAEQARIVELYLDISQQKNPAQPGATR